MFSLYTWKKHKPSTHAAVSSKQGNQGKPRETRGNQGKPREIKGNQEKSRETKGNQGKPRETKGNNGKARGKQGKQAKAITSSKKNHPSRETKGNQGNQGKPRETKKTRENQGKQGETKAKRDKGLGSPQVRPRLASPSSARRSRCWRDGWGEKRPHPQTSTWGGGGGCRTIGSYGCGSELNRRGYAGFGPCFHLPELILVPVL